MDNAPARPGRSIAARTDLYLGVPARKPARRKPTYREIEVKLPVRDVPGLLGFLRSLGIGAGRRVLEKNTVFDTPQADLRRLGRLLRLRIETPASNEYYPGGARRAMLTSKAPALFRAGHTGDARYKERLERELPVADPSRFQEELRDLGFRAGFHYEKYRTSFRFKGLHLSLDETPVGTFLELEGSPRAIDRLARSLGYSPRDYVKSTYWELYSTDCRRRGVRPGNMLLQT
jgi:adenylate cyclase class 2